MARVALWTFDEAPGSGTAADSEIGDGTAQDGVFQNGATTTGSGSGTFDGSNDYVEIPTDAGFDLDAGSVVIPFTQGTPPRQVMMCHMGATPAQTLFLAALLDMAVAGISGIFIQSDGSIGVRHQTADETFDFSGGNVSLGQPTTIVYSWSPTGSQLTVDGIVVDTGSEALTLAGNAEPITIGASQAHSSVGTTDDLRGFFHGEIDRVAIHDEPVEADTIPCFAQGTLILTPNGAVSVENLCVGDLVFTMNHGPQPIRWIGSRSVELGQTAGVGNRFRPVRITAGALGCGLPTRDLLVLTSGLHMLISSIFSGSMFGSANVLGAAIKLTALPGIFVDENINCVEYFHLMFDQHEVIFAEDAPTESLYAGAEAMKAISSQARQEIIALFPELEAESYAPEPAYQIPLGRLQKKLVSRHKKNNKLLLETFATVAEAGRFRQEFRV